MRLHAVALALVLVLAGCGLAASVRPVPTARPGAAGSRGCISPTRLPPIVTVNVDGHEREAIVRGNATLRQPQPLLLVFHSYGGTNRGIEAETDYSHRADEGGFMAVYPQALGSPPSWDLTTIGDLDFVGALLAHVEESVCIDRDRVFATGLSMGGGMANLVGCRLSDRIAAIAPVAGTYGPEYADPCTPDRPVPVLAFHSLDDHVVPYAGGQVADGRLPGLGPVVPVERWAASWARRNGCRASPAQQPLREGVYLLSWGGCRAGVELYRLDAGDHQWPGSAEDPAKAISASDVIWEFFSRQVLRPAP